MSVVHVCAPKPTSKMAFIVDCPDCKNIHPKAKRKSLHVVFHTPYFGIRRTCLCCGREWGDGEWIPLSFYRYARRDNIRSAKKMWRKYALMEDIKMESKK